MTMTSRMGTESTLYTVIDETEMECVCQDTEGYKRTFNKLYVQNMIDSGYLWWPNKSEDIYSKEQNGKDQKESETDQPKEH